MSIEDLGPDAGSEAASVDLFGQPVRTSRRGRGRPQHEATAENRQKVLLWMLTERTDEEIAEALGITPRTLAKHYFHELGYRRTVRMHMEGKLLASIVEQVEKGNAAAMSLFDKKLDKLGLGRRDKPVATKPVKLGKKDQAIVDARNAGVGTPLGQLIN